MSLRAIALRGGQRNSPLVLDAPDDPTDVVASLLDDLDTGGSIVTRQGVYSLDTTQLAVMSIHFEVV